jgi:hypothetical protein
VGADQRGEVVGIEGDVIEALGEDEDVGDVRKPATGSQTSRPASLNPRRLSIANAKIAKRVSPSIEVFP